MDYMDLYVKGGFIDTVNCQGDVTIHGGIIEKLITKGECKQYGGIIEQRVIVTGSHATTQQQAEPKVIYKDRIVYKDRVVYRDKVRDNPQQAVLIQKLQRENSELREALESKEAPLPSDDVLVMRIRSLENELAKEKAEHKNDVEELEYRLDTAIEINAKLRAHNEEAERRSQEIADNHIDILATLMAAYPFTPDKDLEFEFGIPVGRIRETARVLGLIKSPESRREAVDYLQRQHRELIQRRGGDQGNHYTRPVEKVAKYGRLIASYDSVKEAARENGMGLETIRKHCNRYHKPYKEFTKDGFTFRYKKNEDKVST